MKIAFLGLGIMGSRMAANLLKQHRGVKIYNRTPAKADALVKGGAILVRSPAEAADGVDVLFTMLSAPDVVREAALGPAGFLARMREGALWVDSSTVNPSFTREMAAAAADRRLRFMDAPVAGSKGAAEAGELTFMVGAEERDLAETRPLLELMGKKILHVGGVGMGASLKIVNNLLVGHAIVGFSEAIALGRSLGISREYLLNTFMGGPMIPPLLQGKRTKMESGSYDPEFPLRLLHKDLHLAATTAFERGALLPLGNAAKEIFALAMQAGMGDEDYSAIFRMFNK